MSVVHPDLSLELWDGKPATLPVCPGNELHRTWIVSECNVTKTRQDTITFVAELLPPVTFVLAKVLLQGQILLCILFSGLCVTNIATDFSEEKHCLFISRAPINNIAKGIRYGKPGLLLRGTSWHKNNSRQPTSR